MVLIEYLPFCVGGVEGDIRNESTDFGESSV